MTQVPESTWNTLLKLPYPERTLIEIALISPTLKEEELQAYLIHEDKETLLKQFTFISENNSFFSNIEQILEEQPKSIRQALEEHIIQNKNYHSYLLFYLTNITLQDPNLSLKALKTPYTLSQGFSINLFKNYEKQYIELLEKLPCSKNKKLQLLKESLQNMENFHRLRECFHHKGEFKLRIRNLEQLWQWTKREAEYQQLLKSNKPFYQYIPQLKKDAKLFVHQLWDMELNFREGDYLNSIDSLPNFNYPNLIKHRERLGWKHHKETNPIVLADLFVQYYSNIIGLKLSEWNKSQNLDPLFIWLRNWRNTLRRLDITYPEEHWRYFIPQREEDLIHYSSKMNNCIHGLSLGLRSGRIQLAILEFKSPKMHFLDNSWHPLLCLSFAVYKQARKDLLTITLNRDPVSPWEKEEVFLIDDLVSSLKHKPKDDIYWILELSKQRLVNTHKDLWTSYWENIGAYRDHSVWELLELWKSDIHKLTYKRFLGEDTKDKTNYPKEILDKIKKEQFLLKYYFWDSFLFFSRALDKGENGHLFNGKGEYLKIDASKLEAILRGEDIESNQEDNILLAYNLDSIFVKDYVRLDYSSYESFYGLDVIKDNSTTGDRIGVSRGYDNIETMVNEIYNKDYESRELQTEDVDCISQGRYLKAYFLEDNINLKIKKIQGIQYNKDIDSELIASTDISIGDKDGDGIFEYLSQVKSNKDFVFYKHVFVDFLYMKEHGFSYSNKKDGYLCNMDLESRYDIQELFFSYLISSRKEDCNESISLSTFNNSLGLDIGDVYIEDTTKEGKDSSLTLVSVESTYKGFMSWYYSLIFLLFYGTCFRDSNISRRGEYYRGLVILWKEFIFKKISYYRLGYIWKIILSGWFSKEGRGDRYGFKRWLFYFIIRLRFVSLFKGLFPSFRRTKYISLDQIRGKNNIRVSQRIDEYFSKF